ncbi:FtsX-like permease family protein [Spirosoma sp. HMF4905]|uniref:FtsX-like permease family protein n=2 Tax=Spirosoma arboris TaxID=2682092 RepID=A0A7K1SCD6_9BACT|nr:FtsX-like permease family protein [Spirosoma arboris]
MILNYVKIAWRNLLRHKLYSGINIFGLALGMACSLLIGLWVNDERSSNHFLPDLDRLYVVHYNLVREGEILTNLTTPGPLQEAIQKDIPQVESATKIADWPNLLVKPITPKQDQKTGKEQGYYATSGFFDVFRLPALAGNPKAALADPGQIVITRRMAEKYFAGGSALGEQLQLNNDKMYRVGAVIDDLPTASTLQFEWVANFSAFEKEWMKAWGDNPFQTYVRLKPASTAAQTEASMKGIYPRYTDWKSAKEGRIFPILQPLNEVYLYGNYQNGVPVGGRIEYVRIFSIVALFLLLIACINFMNLATARSALRAREIGVRKVIGALRSSLIGQFISESFVTSLLAVGLALSLVWIALPLFNTEFNKQLTLQPTDPALWLIVVGLVLLTGLLSGSYPAVFLSSLQPAKTLKGTLRLGTGPVLFRRALVIVQFTLSTSLIVGMIILGRQMQYLQTKNLGMDRENVVVIPLEGEILKPGRAELVRQRALRLSGVASAATVNHLPTNIQGGSGDLNWPGKDPGQKAEVSADFVGPDFAKMMNIKLLAGRDFQVNRPADSAGYLVNESAAKLMRMTNPIGKEIDFLRGKGPIIGLLQDFHLQSLHQKITPLILAFDDGNASYLLIKLKAGQTSPTLTSLERLIKQANPTYPFTYLFLDEAYGRLYSREQQVTTLINSFGVLAIFISCLGLFGLVAFMAEQRTKEIGIRKVLGASVTSLVTLLSKDFLKLILIAIVIASPIAWYAMNRWLQSFAYRIDLDWWVFALAGLLAVSIALLTISFQSVKAALMNPVKSLRSE